MVDALHSFPTFERPKSGTWRRTHFESKTILQENFLSQPLDCLGLFGVDVWLVWDKPGRGS